MTTLRAVRDDGAGALAERLMADLDSVVVRMGQAYREEIPEYAALAPGQLELEVLPVSRRLVTTFLSCVVEQRPLNRRELQTFEDSGRMRLAMGMPLESVLHAYRIAGREAWSAMCAAVRPGETRLLADLGTRWMDVVDRTCSALTQAYVAASHERLRHVDARRRELVEALLTATDPSEVAAVSLRFSTVLAAAYVPVLVGGTAAAAGVDALLRDAPDGTLAGHRVARVLLLVPHRAAPWRARGDDLTCTGLAAPCGRALLAEVHQVEALLLTALAQGRTSGSFGPDDLLVEQLLLGNDRVAAGLRRRVLDVLTRADSAGVITATLRCYLDTGSVPQTARHELVHANTVGYRLTRVRELTGLDPRIPSDAAVLVLGLGLPTDDQDLR
ncbi:MAG: helix-turn-helix domain-containing protein [Rhodoferax sp.]|nr:helix-turn-helix domain-containing protein [Actinomycetota bacterium]